METTKTFRYRLYPNAEQRAWLERQFGCCRFVYNYFLRLRIDYYAAHREATDKKGLNYHDTARMLTELKRQPEYAWLKEANSQALQHALRHLDAAYTNFFEDRAAFPHFKSKRGTQAFHVPQFFKVDGDHLILPKVGAIKLVLHRPIAGKTRHVTVTKTPTGKYFVSIACRVEMPDPKPVGSEIGIDLGLKSFLATSAGETVESPKYLHKAEKRLKRLQRRLSRRRKGSQGREKARRAVARQHEKVANQRSDFLHKLSRRLVGENQAIHAESLNVKGLLANHALAKSIADARWGEFLRQIKYKGQWYGCALYQIDRFFPSSKRCHVCGYIKQDLTLCDREWDCPECDAHHDRDVNAAINILTFKIQTRAGTAQSHTPVETRDAESLKPEASRF